jgi:hypothetical protein
MSSEQQRFDDVPNQKIPWKTWGHDLSERRWGTVCEDYSDDRNAWNGQILSVNGHGKTEEMQGEF